PHRGAGTARSAGWCALARHGVCGCLTPSISKPAMTQNSRRWPLLLIALLSPVASARALDDKPGPARPDAPSPEEVLGGVKEFFKKTARPDGSFRPGLDPDYRGMSDSAYSDLAPVTYAVILHRTFGWKLPH